MTSRVKVTLSAPEVSGDRLADELVEVLLSLDSERVNRKKNGSDRDSGDITMTTLSSYSCDQTFMRKLCQRLITDYKNNKNKDKSKNINT